MADSSSPAESPEKVRSEISANISGSAENIISSSPATFASGPSLQPARADAGQIDPFERLFASLDERLQLALQQNGFSDDPSSSQASLGRDDGALLDRSDYHHADDVDDPDGDDALSFDYEQDAYLPLPEEATSGMQAVTGPSPAYGPLSSASRSAMSAVTAIPSAGSTSTAPNASAPAGTLVLSTSALDHLPLFAQASSSSSSSSAAVAPAGLPTAPTHISSAAVSSVAIAAISAPAVTSSLSSAHTVMGHAVPSSSDATASIVKPSVALETRPAIAADTVTSSYVSFGSLTAVTPLRGSSSHGFSTASAPAPVPANTAVTSTSVESVSAADHAMARHGKKGSTSTLIPFVTSSSIYDDPSNIRASIDAPLPAVPQAASSAGSGPLFNSHANRRAQNEPLIRTPPTVTSSLSSLRTGQSQPAGTSATGTASAAMLPAGAMHSVMAFSSRAPLINTGLSPSRRLEYEELMPRSPIDVECTDLNRSASSELIPFMADDSTADAGTKALRYDALAADIESMFTASQRGRMAVMNAGGDGDDQGDGDDPSDQTQSGWRDRRSSAAVIAASASVTSLNKAASGVEERLLSQSMQTSRADTELGSSSSHRSTAKRAAGQADRLSQSFSANDLHHVGVSPSRGTATANAVARLMNTVPATAAGMLHKAKAH